MRTRSPLRSFALSLILLLLCVSFPSPSCANEEFLAPEQAFRFLARSLDSKTVEARFTIADGYYLYRERFKFSADSAQAAQQKVVRLGEPVYPAAKIKFDQTFRRNVEYYRNEVLIRIPIVAVSPERSEHPPGESLAQLPRTFTLRATYQGCADAGLCYAPIEAQAAVDFALPGSLLPAKGRTDRTIDSTNAR